MPIYDYQCNKCGHEFTLIRNIRNRNDVENIICSSCMSQGNVQKIVSKSRILTPVLDERKLPSDFKKRMESIRSFYPKMKCDFV